MTELSYSIDLTSNFNCVIKAEVALGTHSLMLILIDHS